MQLTDGRGRYCGSDEAGRDPLWSRRLPENARAPGGGSQPVAEPGGGRRSAPRWSRQDGAFSRSYRVSAAWVESGPALGQLPSGTWNGSDQQACAMVVRLVQQACCEDGTRPRPGRPRGGAAVETRAATRRPACRFRRTIWSPGLYVPMGNSTRPAASSQPRHGGYVARSTRNLVLGRHTASAAPATGSTSCGRPGAGSTPTPRHRTCRRGLVCPARADALGPESGPRKWSPGRHRNP